MPRIAIDTTKGQYTNTDEFASGQPGQIVNLLVDEHGTLTSRPGLSAWASTSNSAAGLAGGTDESVIAIHPYRDRLVAVTANRRVKVITSAGVVTDISTPYLAGWKQPTFLLDDDGRLVIFGGGAPLRLGQTYTVSALSTSLSGAPTHGGIVDRVMLVNDDGTSTVHFSDVFDHTNFDYAAAIAASESTPGILSAGTRSDNVTAIAALNNRVLLFGPESVEAFYGTGLGGGQPAFRLEDDPMQSSIGAPFSLVEVDDTLWWVDSDRRLVKLEGRAANAKSLAVEAQLLAMAYYDDCVAHLCDFQGHHLILLHFNQQGLTLVYDYVRDVWSEWRRWSTVTGDWSGMPLRGYAYHPEWNRHFCSGDSNGRVYELSATTYQDYAGSAVTPLVRLWRGPYTDAGDLSLKFGRRLQFLLDGGVAQSYTSTSDAYNPTIEVRWRNEDRQWQEWRQMQTGAIGSQYSVRDVWCRTTFRRTQVEWRSSSPAPLRVNRIELEATPRTR